MKPNYLIIAIALVVFADGVLGIEFTENTTFTEGNINYRFIEGIKVNSFTIYPEGIRIDDVKMGFVIQGGEIIISIYSLEKISIWSSVPQEVEFQVAKDGKRQYLHDGKSYHLSNYRIGMEEVFFDFMMFEEEQVSASIPKKAGNLPWYEQKIFEVEVKTSVDSQGIVTGDTFSLTYFWAFLVFFSGLGSMVVFLALR